MKRRKLEHGGTWVALLASAVLVVWSCAAGDSSESVGQWSYSLASAGNRHNWVVAEVRKSSGADIRADIGSPPGAPVRDGVVDAMDVLAAECATNAELGSPLPFPRVNPCPVDFDAAAFAAVPMTAASECSDDRYCRPSFGQCSSNAICRCVPIGNTGVSWCEPKLRRPGVRGCGTAAVDAQYFGDNMVLCAGTVSFANRASLCAPGLTPCTSAQWVQWHGTTAPLYDAWTNDNLRWNAVTGACWVSTTTGTQCPGGSGGDNMAVTTSLQGLDVLGNTAMGLYDCGNGAAPPPNHYFGGCLPTAGTLCCK